MRFTQASKYKRYALLFFALFLSSAVHAFTVVIDAGHGGKDAGALGKYSKEKNINLTVALKVGRLIQNNCGGVKVIYTRSTDVFVDLHERAAIANRAKADLFISIHTNALPKGKIVSGAETYTLGMARSNENLDVAKRENSVILYENDYQKRYAGFNPNSSESYIIFEFMQDQYMKQSAELAKAIQSQYTYSAHRVNKGVKQAGFLVLRETSMPSVLTELGFISTPSEESFLNSATGTDEMASCIYLGFVNYWKSYAKGQGAVSIPIASETKKQIKLTDNETEDSPNIPISKDQTSKNQISSPVLPGEIPPPLPEIKHDDQTNTTKPLEAVQQNESTSTQSQTRESSISVAYRIQILTSSKPLSKNNTQFKGLDKIDFYKEGGIYKYTYENTTSYSEIITRKNEIAKHFPGCFVIAIKDGQRISVQEAKEILSSKR